MADESQGAGSRTGSGTNSPAPEGGSRPATESLLHTQRIAEGFFDLSRGVGAAAGGGSPGDGAFERFRAGVPRVGGRHPDAFDVSARRFYWAGGGVEVAMFERGGRGGVEGRKGVR